MSVNNEQYSYESGFQERQLALILRDLSFVRDYRDIINPSYFSDERITILAKLALEFYDSYGELTNKDTLKEYVKDYCTKFKVDYLYRKEIFMIMKKMYEIDLSNVKEVKKRTVSFGQNQAMKKAALQIGSLISESKDLSQSREIVNKALCVGHAVSELGSHLGTDLKRLPQLAKDSSYSITQKIPSPWTTLNKNSHGGPSRKELWVLLGFSGVGKSINMVEIGATALLIGYPVVHFTIGDLDEIDVELRYASRLTKCTIPEIINSSDKYIKSSEKVLKQGNTNLHIKYFPSETATVGSIHSHLSKLKYSKGINPGLVIVDYPDELKFEDSYRGLGTIYSQLRNMAEEFNTCVWVVSQIERKPFKDSKKDPRRNFITMGSIDNSKLKYNKADGIVSFNQEPDEDEEGVARLWVDKARRNKSKYHISLKVDKTIYSIKEQGDRYINPALEEKELKSTD